MSPFGTRRLLGRERKEGRKQMVEYLHPNIFHFSEGKYPQWFGRYSHIATHPNLPSKNMKEDFLSNCSKPTQEQPFDSSLDG